MRWALLLTLLCLAACEGDRLSRERATDGSSVAERTDPDGGVAQVLFDQPDAARTAGGSPCRTAYADDSDHGLVAHDPPPSCDR